MSKYRLNKAGLWDTLEVWEGYLPTGVRLVACGGTALTLQDLKESTKDVDFLVPDDEEYKALIRTIRRLNYRQTTGNGWARGGDFVFDLFRGKTVFQTELLDSPLEPGRHIPIRTAGKLFVSALNDLDLIISKMFRGTDVDVEDCLTLIRSREGLFDLEALKARYRETANYALQTDEMLRHLEYLLSRLRG